MTDVRDDEPRRDDADQTTGVDTALDRSIEDDEGVGYDDEPSADNTAGMDPADSEDLEYRNEDRLGS
jgi:hypothetical protein